MKIFAVLAFSILASSAQASFTGEWFGAAVLTTKGGVKYLCEDVSIDVKQDKDQIVFGKFYYGCGGLAFSFVPPTLKFVDDQNVTWKDQNVGTVTDRKAELLFVINDKNGKARYFVEKISDTEIYYLDEQIDVDPETGKDVVVSHLEGKLTISTQP